MRYKIKKSNNKSQSDCFKKIINREFVTKAPVRYNHVRAEIDGEIHFIPLENLEIIENEDSIQD